MNSNPNCNDRSKCCPASTQAKRNSGGKSSLLGPIVILILLLALAATPFAAMHMGIRYTEEGRYDKATSCFVLLELLPISFPEAEPYQAYIEGWNMMNEEKYELAAETFEDLGDFMDSEEKAAQAKEKLAEEKQ